MTPDVTAAAQELDLRIVCDGERVIVMTGRGARQSQRWARRLIDSHTLQLILLVVFCGSLHAAAVTYRWKDVDFVVWAIWGIGFGSFVPYWITSPEAITTTFDNSRREVFQERDWFGKTWSRRTLGFDSVMGFCPFEVYNENTPNDWAVGYVGHDGTNYPLSGTYSLEKPYEESRARKKAAAGTLAKSLATMTGRPLLNDVKA